MSFNYEQSIWGKGIASLNWADPTSFRLRQALAAIKNLPANNRVLEVGCGAGQFIRAIKRCRPDLTCCGCDISRQAIEMARSGECEKGNVERGVDYALSEVERLPYDDSSFDGVFIFDVLEHASNPQALVGEIKRVLKPNGIFYCYVPCEGDWLSVWNLRKKLGIKVDLTEKYAGHINKFSRKSFFQLLKKADFNIVNIRYSEHVLGQLLGLVVFKMMDKMAKKQKLSQLNNEQFFNAINAKQGKKFGFLKKIINTLINLESFLFCRVPTANTHILSHKS